MRHPRPLSVSRPSSSGDPLRRRPLTPAVGLDLAAAVIMLSTARTSALAADTAGRHSVTSSPPAASTAAVSHANHPLILLTGDRLAPASSPASGRPMALFPAPGSGSGVLSLRAGGQQSEIPVDALPYLGHGLSPSLFELSALEHAESGGRLHTLTVTAANQFGKPDTGDQVMVFDLGDPAISDFGTFYHGVAKLSVPSGSYWGGALMGSNARPRLVILPQVTVRGATTVHVAALAASSKITMATPRPADPQTASFTVVRRLRRDVTSMSVDDFPSLYISQVRKKPAMGTLQAYAEAQLVSPARAAGTPYAYDLAYADRHGIVPAQRYAVAPGSLATVREDFYQAVPSTGGWGTEGGYAAQVPGLILVLPRRNSGQLVQYLTGGPDLAWLSFYSSFDNRAGLYGAQFGGFQSYAAGQQVTEDWDQYPLHPGFDMQLLHGALAAAFPVLASAVRSGSDLSLAPSLFSDNQSGHQGFGTAGPDTKLTGSWAVGQHGRKIAGGSSPEDGIPAVRLSPRPSVVTFRVAAARRDPHFPLSTSVTTTWTWHFRPRPSATVPGGWYCGFSSSFQLLRRCAVQPLLTLGYHVHGMRAAGEALAGPQVIGLDIGHLQLTAASPVTRASAQVSFSDGRDWRPAAITAAGRGQFRITFTAPPGPR